VSGNRLIQTRLELKFWTNGVPEIDAVRPPRCLGCGAASHAPGSKVIVVGHGVRRRQMRGPLRVGDEPGELEYQIRRYRCRQCGAVMTAGPKERLRCRLFSLPAITWALWLYGVECISSRAVRHRISPWRKVGAAADRTWQTLRRWLGAARDGRLFPFPIKASGRPRQLAERVSRVLMAKAPPSFATAKGSEQSVAGALYSAMGITPCAAV